jgi:succinyl-CoA synthetase beta subunit
MKVPLVVRLEGNKAEEGKQILSKSGLKLSAASSLDEAAKLIVAAVKSK